MAQIGDGIPRWDNMPGNWMKMGVFFTLGNTPISAVKLYFSTLRTYPTVQSANHIARW
jgi:hypothetical protein